MKRKSCDSQIKTLVDDYANRSDATGMNLNELMEFKEERIHLFTLPHSGYRRRSQECEKTRTVLV